MILSALLTFSIVSCDLCLVLCSIDDNEHLIMNVLVYSDKGGKNQTKPKTQSEFNSVYNKRIKTKTVTLLARETEQGQGRSQPCSFCGNKRSIPVQFITPNYLHSSSSPFFVLFSFLSLPFVGFLFVLGLVLCVVWVSSPRCSRVCELVPEG